MSPWWFVDAAEVFELTSRPNSSFAHVLGSANGYRLTG